MYILAGEKKGATLVVPKEGTRPTTNKVKKSLFDSLQGYIENTDVLDLFAGSGSLGLEALSRGAKTATFVDYDRHAVMCIKKNIEKLGYDFCAQVLQQDIKEKISLNKTFDLIFIDPPYDLDAKKICENALSLLNQGGLMIVEQSKRANFITQMSYKRKKEYGDTVIYFFQSIDETS